MGPADFAGFRRVCAYERDDFEAPNGLELSLQTITPDTGRRFHFNGLAFSTAFGQIDGKLEWAWEIMSGKEASHAIVHHPERPERLHPSRGRGEESFLFSECIWFQH